MAKEFSVKGPIFKLALEHGTGFMRFAPGAKTGKPVKPKAVQALVDKGIYAWFAYMPINSWGGRATERWRVGESERGDYVEFQAPKDSELSWMKDMAAAEAAKASGGSRKPPRALVKELVEAVKDDEEPTVARLAPLAAAGEFEDRRPIDVAAGLGKPRLVELLLPHCDPNLAREDGAIEPAALLSAVHSGSVETAQLLLARCDPKTTNAGGWTALMSAATSREGAAMTALLLPLSDVDAAESREGRTALMMAAQAGKAEVASMLLPQADLHKQDAKGRTALMLAADADGWSNNMDWHERDQRLAIVAELLAAGAKPDLRDFEGHTALTHAVRRSFVEAVGPLAVASDLAAANNEGDTALTLAARGGRIDALRAVLDGSEVDHKNKDGDTALIIAARAAWPEGVATLCKRANCDAQNAKGRTALMEALSALTSRKSGWSSGNDMGPLRCVLRLLPLTNLDLQDQKGETALMKCGDAALPELLGLMLPGANVDMRDASGATALARLCSARDDAECFELVLERADARVADNEGITPLMRAVNDPGRLMRLLARSDLDARDANGRTALMHAADGYAAEEAVKILLEARADAALLDHAGRSAEAIARARGDGFEELANLLRDVASSNSLADELAELIPVPIRPPKTAEAPKKAKRRTGGL